MTSTSGQAPELHEAVRYLAPLLGTWTGSGTGEYPTIESFGYVEEITFGHVGKPFLAYTQKTRHAQTGLPLHAESGYWRGLQSAEQPTHRIEVVLAHPTGILEAQAGTAAVTRGGLTIELSSTAITRTASAQVVTEVQRRFEISGDTLTYRVAMAAVGVPLTHHLAAELHRT